MFQMSLIKGRVMNTLDVTHSDPVLQKGQFPNGSGFYNTNSFLFYTDLKLS